MAAKGFVVGNLGRDANTGYASNGNFRAFFNVASSRRFTNAAGEKQSVTTWVSCHYWGKGAEAVAQYLVKGKKVAVTGNLETKQEKDRDGNEVERLVLVVNDLELLSSQNEGSQSETPKEEAAIEDDDEIPF